MTDARLQPFLDAVPKLHETARCQRLMRLRKYYDGTQYKDRKLDIAGDVKGQPGVSGSMVGPPAWDQRDPGAVNNIREEVVTELTGWAVGSDSWCELTAKDDPSTQAWIRQVALDTDLADVVSDARDFGGSQGTAIVAAVIRDDEACLEALEPCITWPLEWVDPNRWIPSIVAQVYVEDSMLRMCGDDSPIVARIWDTQNEIVYRYARPRRDEPPFWSFVSATPHGFDECPVVWAPQFARPGQIDGVPDGEGSEDAIDDLNYNFGAASATTKRNAEDTLVLRMDPNLVGGLVRKGAGKYIVSPGGAEYLSQNGDSARVSMDVAERRVQQVHRRSKVVIPTAEEIGKLASGEVLRRRFQTMLKRISRLRRHYARRLILPLCRMLVRAGRSGRITVSDLETIDPVLGKVIEARRPGTSDRIECVWPDPFPPTWADKVSAISITVQGTGNKQVISVPTAIEILRSVGLPVKPTEIELKQIEHDAHEAAEVSARAMGLAEPGPGKAGPITTQAETDEADDQEEGDDETSDDVAAE